MDPTKKKTGQQKADGGLIVASTKKTVLMIEVKRCSHDESKEDFLKLMNSMIKTYNRQKNYIVGILVVGELIVVYLIMKKGGYRCILEVSRCYFPVTIDDFSRIPRLYCTLKKAMNLIEISVENHFS